MSNVDLIDGRLHRMPDVTSEGRKFNRRLFLSAMAMVTGFASGHVAYNFGAWVGTMLIQ
jgi:hypothetical protein